VEPGDVATPVEGVGNYLPKPDILFISHCVPNPPEKGEKIRSFHLIHYLAQRYRVHLVCFARAQSEIPAANALESVCASVYVELLPSLPALIRGGMRLLFGGCLNAGFYWSPRMKRHVDAMTRQTQFQAALVYAAVMHPYAPSGVPVLLDMQDVDSEKWFEYAGRRFPGFLFALEASRLRDFERAGAQAADCTFLTTAREEALLRRIAPGAATGFMENGVEVRDWNGETAVPEAFAGKRFIAFIGTLDYYPNADAAQWFATCIFPKLRLRHPGLEFLIIGRQPTPQVQKLGALEGVTVTCSGPQTIHCFRPGRCGSAAACPRDSEQSDRSSCTRPQSLRLGSCLSHFWKLAACRCGRMFLGERVHSPPG